MKGDKSFILVDICSESVYTKNIPKGNSMNLARAKSEFEKHAREPLELKELGGAIYALGSELACLRLYKIYRYCGDRADTGFSLNMNTWYFRLETL